VDALFFDFADLVSAVESGDVGLRLDSGTTTDADLLFALFLRQLGSGERLYIGIAPYTGAVDRRLQLATLEGIRAMMAEAMRTDHMKPPENVSGFAFTEVEHTEAQRVINAE